MSASLVGSEMCIRDRLRRLRRAAEPPEPAQAGRRWVHRHAARARRNVKAVSYTHLTLPTICSV
eukprot:8010681-Alexandrium_andersonii.AAC.1